MRTGFNKVTCVSVGGDGPGGRQRGPQERPRLSRLSVVVLLIPMFACGVASEAQPACRALSESPLAALEGSWTVEWSYRLAPGKFLETAGTAEITKDLYGCMLVERFTASIDSVPYQGIVLFTAPTVGQLDRVTVDSQHGGLIRHEGTASGDTLSFVWQLDLGERLLRTRHLYILSDNDHVIREHMLSPALEAPWELRQRAVYTRKHGTGN